MASRRNGARSFVAIALLLAGALAVGVFALSKRGAAPNAAAPAARADAGLVVAAIAPADAGVAAVARDAAPAATSIADAAPPRRIARKKPERRVSPPTDRPPADPAPEDPPPKEPAVPAELGKLTVAAEPYALVRIDGTEVGATPIFGRSIAAGPHEIVLSSPDSGEIRLKRRIVIAPGEHEKVILK